MTDILRRIRVVTYEDAPFYRKYCVTAPISSEPINSDNLATRAKHNKLRVASEDMMDAPSPDQVLQLFYNMVCVTRVVLEKASICISFNFAFNWDEAEDDILSCVKRAAGWSNEDVVEVEYVLKGEIYPTVDDLNREYELTRARYLKSDRYLKS